MNVLHISNDYRENNLYSVLFKKLSNRNIVQTVFVPSRKDLQFDSSLVSYEIVCCKPFNNFDRINFNTKRKKIYNYLRRNVDLKAFDIIHAHTLFSNGVIAYDVNANFGVDYIVTVRGTDVNIFFKKLIYLRKIGLDILRNAKRIIFISQAIKDKVLRYCRDNQLITDIESKSSIIPNGIDDFWFENLNIDRKNNLSKGISVIHVGWINSNKNQFNTVKAVEIVNEKGYNCDLHIVGGVEYKKDFRYFHKLNNLINNSKYKGKLKVYGKKQKNDLINYYGKSDILLVPSFQETFGLVYIEALSQGLPIIYSNFQGVDGMFDNYPVGKPANPNDPIDIANKVIDIANNYKEYSDNISKHIFKYSWGSVIEQIIENYI